MLKVAGLSKSSYFYNQTKDGKDCKNIEIVKEITKIFYIHGKNYGYRRITDELHNLGYVINHKKVKRLMTINNLFGVAKKQRYHSYKGCVGHIADNLIKRDFYASMPNQKWATDVTQFTCVWGKAYLSPILDMFNDEIVAYNLSRTPNFNQIEEMLDEAYKKHPSLEGCIIHSDQGWQYQNPRYVRSLKEHNYIQSMSRKANCLDNAIMESFFGVLKREMFYDHELEFKSFSQLKKAIDEYIYYYNNIRIKHNLDGLSPVKYRQKIENMIV